MGGRRTRANGAWVMLVGLLVAGLVCGAIAGCSSKTASGPSTPADELTCLTSLPTYCCGRTGDRACDPTWENARLCTAWALGTPVTIYETACQGLRAVRVTAATYSSFYVYDATSSALVAIADNAAEDPGSTDIACGAGPTGFTVPPQCSAAWLAKDGASACDGSDGASRATHDWCHDLYDDAGN